MLSITAHFPLSSVNQVVCYQWACLTSTACAFCSPLPVTVLHPGPMCWWWSSPCCPQRPLLLPTSAFRQPYRRWASICLLLFNPRAAGRTIRFFGYKIKIGLSNSWLSVRTFIKYFPRLWELSCCLPPVLSSLPLIPSCHPLLSHRSCYWQTLTRYLITQHYVPVTLWNVKGDVRPMSGNIFSPHITGESTFAVQADLQPGRQSSWWIWRCGPVPSTQHLGEAVMAKTALVIWSQASFRLGLKLSLVVGSSHGVLGSAGLNHAMMLNSASTQCLPSHSPSLYSFSYTAFSFFPTESLI